MPAMPKDNMARVPGHNDIERAHRERARVERLERLQDHLAETNNTECHGHDNTVPGGDPVGRYAVHIISQEGRHQELTRTSGRQRAELVAEAAVSAGYSVEALYDLDVLEGPEALPDEVIYQGENWMVHGSETDPSSRGKGAAALIYTGKWTLKKSPADRRRSSYDWTDGVDPADCDLLGWEDERLPVRYDVAGTRVVVLFNTTPTRED